MGKFTKLIAALCCISTLNMMLCACSNYKGELAFESVTPKAKIKEQTKKSQSESFDFNLNDFEISVNTSAESEDNDVNSKDIITVTGNPLSPEQLVDFHIDWEWADKVVANGYAGEFLDTLGNIKFKDLYCRALALIHIMSSYNLDLADGISAYENSSTYLEVFNEKTGINETYTETGYSYDSFYRTFRDVFTPEAIEIILFNYPFYYSYNEGLWYKPIVRIFGNPGEVYQEYELISESDTELKFKRISYSVAIGEPVTEYDPNKKNEYIKTEVNFRFVNTENGWRVAEFLNAINYNE